MNVAVDKLTSALLWQRAHHSALHNAMVDHSKRGAELFDAMAQSQRDLIELERAIVALGGVVPTGASADKQE